MCGIVGTIGCSNKELLLKMNEIQVHRGPDDEGVYWNKETKVGLAMRRLSIVDISTGHQPMSNEDGSIIVVYNGEIFNAPELRKELIDRKHIFRTVNSDTEILVHLYEDYGSDMLNKLNGMFAFAIYDTRKQIVFVARDHMGIKPLHYCWNSGNRQMAFASEMKSLTKAGVSAKKKDMCSVSHFLSFQCVPAPNTIYEDIKILPAAHYFIYNLETDEIEIKRYWNCYDNRKIFAGGKAEIVDYLKEEIIDAIERWTMSDVPLACSLSGGLDSAVIAAIIGKKQDIHTYTLGFEHNSKHDERELARKLSSLYGTKHEEIVIAERDIIEELPQIVNSLDNPYAGGVPSWFVCKAVCNNEKVLFNGTGGDELFGNYGKWLRYEHPLERVRMMKKYVRWGESLSELMKYPSGSIYHKYIPEKMKRDILLKEYSEECNSSLLCEQIWKECRDKRWRTKVPYIDFQIQLPEEFLMMIDRFSMHFSIEARVPFLDRELVERVLGVSPSIRTKKYYYKYLLKEIAKDILPREYIEAPKHGFVLPYQEWLQGELKPLVLDLCTGDYVRNQDIFSDDLENKLIRPFYEGKTELTPLIWTVLMFQMWSKQN